MAVNPDYKDWKVQLSKTYEPGIIHPKQHFVLTKKINGCRATFFDDFLISRNGKIFKGFEDTILRDLRVLQELRNTNTEVFDGELVYINKEGLSDNDAFKKGTGICNASKDMTNKDQIKYIIFDVIHEIDFCNEDCDTDYEIRRGVLDDTATYIERYGLTNIEILPVLYVGNDQSQIEYWINEATKRGWEGIMINLLDGCYDFKRSNKIFKYKKFNTIDLQVIGFEEGLGKNAGMLGALRCKVADDPNFKYISVGSGFDDIERIDIWNNKEKYLGQIIECSYKEITSDKVSELQSIQFPVFLGWRFDLC